MPEIVKTVVYRFDELTVAAKDKAREWYREVSQHDDWYDAVYEDFAAICGILGVTLRKVPVRLYGGGTRQAPCIHFSGFWSQSDGASYEGSYAYQREASRHIREYAPQDEFLHEVADTLQSVQRRNFYQLHAHISHRGHYYHEYSMSISIERSNDQGLSENDEDRLSEALRDLARWLYQQLEKEWDYQNSDEIVDEGILANEYTFVSSGQRFG